MHLNRQIICGKNARFPIYKQTETTFFPIGEEKFKAIVEELKKRKNLYF